MSNSLIYRALSLTILFLLLINQSIALANGSNQGMKVVQTTEVEKPVLFHNFRDWIRATSDQNLLNKLFIDVIPPSGKFHDPFVEALFWTRAVPEKWLNGYYEKYLFEKLVPMNKSNGYYYYTLFREILNLGFKKYYLGEEAPAIVDYDVFRYYYVKVFKQLVINRDYNGFYYNLTFYDLYYNDVWGYQKILAYIAYYDDPTGTYAVELTRIDLEKQLGDNFLAEQPHVIYSGGSSRIIFQLYTPDGPLVNSPIYIYTYRYCSTWCSGSYMGTVYTNGSGVAVAYLPPGTYMAELGGLAGGSMVDISLGVNDTVTISELLGKLHLQLLDRNDQPIIGLGISLYSQMTGLNGEPEPGMEISYDLLDSTGSITKYLLPGTYMVRVEVPGLENQYIPNLVVESGEVNSYVYSVEVVPLNIELLIPPITTHYSLWIEVYRELGDDGPVETVIMGSSRSSETVYLSPGHYYLVLSSIYVNYRFIDIYNVSEIDVRVGVTNSFTYVFGAVAWEPSNLAGYPDASIGVEVFKTEFINSTNVPYAEIADMMLSYGDELILPPSRYAFRLKGLDEYLADYYVVVEPYSISYITDRLPVGFLNLSTLYGSTRIGKQCIIYAHIDTGTQYHRWASTSTVIPLPPGVYDVSIRGIGLNNTFENIVITENHTVDITIRLGKLVVELYSYNHTRLEQQIPVYVAPYIDDTLITDYEFIAQVYASDTAEFYLSPGTYAVIIPGTNASYFYGGFNVGYGETRVNITLDPNHLANMSFNLGRLVVNINTPRDVLRPGFPNGLYVTVATQTVINGSPAIGDYVNNQYLWMNGSYVFELTPGTYTVYISTRDDIVLDNTIRYNIVVEPNGIVNVNYDFKLVTLNLTLDSGEPARYLIVGLTINGHTYTVGVSDRNGLVSFLMLEGIYNVSYTTFYSEVIGEINITSDEKQLFNLVVPSGKLRIYAYGPGGEPLPNIGFKVSLGYMVFTTYTDMDGVAEVSAPPGTYTVSPTLSPGEEYSSTIYMDRGEVEEITYRFAAVNIYFNTSLSIGYFNLYIVDRDSGRYVNLYHSLFYGYERTVYLPPGNYSIVLPGFSTNPMGFYGYGEEANLTLPDNSSVEYVVLNITYIVLELNVTDRLDRYIEVELKALALDGSFIDTISSYYLSGYDDPCRASFIVSPGTYGLTVSGPPHSYWNVVGYGVSYTNITATTSSPAIITYSPGRLIIRIISDIASNVEQTLYLYYFVNGYWSTMTSRELGVGEATYFYLSNGTYLVRYGTSEKLVDIRCGETTYVEFTVTGIAVHLTGPENEPVINAEVLLYTNTGYYVGSTYTDQYGRAMFVVDPGNYTVILRGLNYYYSVYYVGLYENRTFGLGEAYPVYFNGSITTYIEIRLARIDLAVHSPNGPAPGVQASLYSVDGAYPLKGGLTSSDGRVSFYVVPGNYSIIIRGRDYGWSDFYYLDLSAYRSNGYGDMFIVEAPGTSVYNFTYSIGELIVYAGRTTGEPIADTHVYVYDADESYELHETSTNESGYAVIYLTPGAYKVYVAGVSRDVNITLDSSTIVNVTLSKLIIKLKIPDQRLLDLDPDLLAYKTIFIRKGYNETNPGVEVGTVVTEFDGVATIFLPAYETYQIILPGIDTIESYGSMFGYGEYVSIYLDRDLDVEFNVSVIGVKATGPHGSLSGLTINMYTYDTHEYIGSYYVDNGYVFVPVTKGMYYLTLPYVLGSTPFIANITGFEIVWWNVTLSTILLKHVHSTSYSGVDIVVEDATTGLTQHSTVYNDEIVYVGTGTFYVYNTRYYGYVYNYTVEISSGGVEEIVAFTTRNIYFQVYRPDGTLNNEYSKIYIYTQKGTINDPETDYVVRYQTSSSGEFTVLSLTPGLYVIQYPTYPSYGGHPVYLYNNNLTSGNDLYVNYTLGQLNIEIVYNDGTPVSNNRVVLYTASPSLNIEASVKTCYTDIDGLCSFYVTEGYYALYIDNLGYVYGIYVDSGEVVNKTYSLSPADLAVTSVSWTPTQPGDGDTILFSVNITNYGPGHVLSVFHVAFYLNDTLVYTAEVQGLLVGYTATVVAPITAIAGVDVVRVEVDPYMEIYDSNRSNNVYTTYINVLKPDLTIRSITVSPELVDGGVGEAYINITNYGPSSIHHRFYVDIYYDGEKIRTTAIDQLEVNATVTITIVFDVKGGYHSIKAIVDPGNEVVEENEMNNEKMYIFHVPEPDLEVVSMNLDVSESIDGAIGVWNVTIRNNGATTIQPFFIYLYVDGARYGLNYKYGGLEANESFTTQFYVVLKGGTHNYTVVVDPDARIGDPDRVNNIETVIIYVPPPDLAIVNVSYHPTTPGDGETVTFNVTIQNIGVGATISNFYVTLYVDGVAKTSTYVFEDLDVGETVNVVLQTRFSAGNRSVVIIVDSEHKIGDSYWLNNEWASIIHVLYSDLELVYLWLNTSSGTYYNGMMGELWFTIRNNGPGNVNKTFYVSVFDNGKFVEQIPVDGLTVGETLNLSSNIVFYTGIHTYTVIVDDQYQRYYGGGYIYGHTHLVADLNRGNNVGNTTVYVMGPDLVITNIYIYPETPVAYATYSLNVTVSNIGDYDLETSVWGLINIDGEETLFEIPPISVNESINVTVKHLPGLEPGLHKAVVEANPYKEVLEHSYDNNKYMFTIEIPYPDLVVENATVYASTVVDYLDEYNVSITIRNNGWGFSHDFYVSIYRESTGTPITRYYVDHGLASGESINITITIVAVPPGGSLRIVVNDDGLVLENNIGNNVLIVEAPLVKHLSIYRTTYEFLYGLLENSTFRIDNTGDVALSITSITTSTSQVYIDDSSLPSTIESSSYLELPIHVDTVSLGIGVYTVNVTIYTSGSLNYTATLTIVVYNTTNMFDIKPVLLGEPYSLGGTGALDVDIVYRYPAFKSNVEINLTGNATVFFDQTCFTVIDIFPSFSKSFYIDHVYSDRDVYELIVTAKLLDYGVAITKKLYFTVYRKPIVRLLSPRGNNTVLASTTLVVSWTTNIPTNATIYFRSIHDTTWKTIPLEEFKQYQRVYLGGLVSGETYMFYMVVYSLLGESVAVGPYVFNVTTSVVFRQHEINVTIDREYNQIVYIEIENLDPAFPHSVYARVINTDPEIMLDFIGPGSTDAMLSIGLRSTASLMLAIHAQDAVKLNYTVTAMLVDLDTNATDYMVLHIYVREPVFNVEVEYLGMDNNTLIQTYKLINHGDTITDLKVYLTGPASSYAYIYPSMNHVYLKSGQTLIFYVIPILAKYPEDVSLLNGTIVVETSDPQSTNYPLNPIKLPEGYRIYGVTVEHMVLSGKSNDWYCTNRPHVTTKLRVSGDPASGEDGLQYRVRLSVFFTPRYSSWDVKPHDGDIYVNGYKVYSWHNTIPEGYIVVDVPSEAVTISPSGEVSDVEITIDTRHLNGGHYIVATSFTLTIEVAGGKFYIAAPSYDEAREKLRKVFKPSIQNVEPKECDRSVEMPSWLSRMLSSLPDQVTYDFGDIKLPAIAEKFIGGSIETGAKVSLVKEIEPNLVSIGIKGEFEAYIGQYGVEGQATGSAKWGIRDCAWTFLGGEITGSLHGGYRFKAEVPVTWLSWVTEDPVEFEVKVSIGVTSSKIVLDERLHISRVDTLLIGVRVYGKATINLGSRTGLEAELEGTMSMGWSGGRFNGKIAFTVTGNVKVNVGWFELSKSGSYGTGFKYESGSGWRLLSPGEDPEIIVSEYRFYSDQLGYPYILLAENYSSIAPSPAYSSGYGVYATWIATDGNNSYIMLDRYSSGSWSSVETLPFPSDKWYSRAYALGFNDHPALIVLEMPMVNLSTATYEDILKAMNNQTVLFSEYVNGSWVSPTILVEEGVSWAFDAATNGVEAVAAWIENTSSEYAVYAMIYSGGSWSPPSMIGESGSGGLDYKIRDVAVSFINNTPVVCWIVDVYRNVSGDTGELVTVIKYSMLENGAWSEPETIPDTWKAMYLSAPSVGSVVVWSSSDQKIYVSAFNESTWETYLLGSGEEPVTEMYGDVALIVANTYGGEDLILYSFNSSSTTYSSTPLTNDTVEDTYYTILPLQSMGKALITWCRRPASTTGLGDDEAWAYGLYYYELGSTSIKEFSIKPLEVVEGSSVNVKVVVSSTVNASTTLVVEVNDTVVYNIVLNLTNGVDVVVEFNYTIHDSGVYLFEAYITNTTPASLLPTPRLTAYVYVSSLLNVSEPKPYSYVDEIFNVTGEVRGDKPVNLTIYVNGTVVAERTSVLSGFNIVVNVSSYPDSPLNLKIHAVTIDSSAEDVYSEIIYLDKTPPTIDILSPRNNTYVRETINITVEAHDISYSLPGNPIIYVNGEPYNTTLIDNNLYIYMLDTTMYSDGVELNITAYVVDVSGKTSSETIYVVVDNTAPTTSHNSTKTWYNHDVVVELRSTDTASGVNATYYRIDNGVWFEGSIVEIPAPLDHSNDGLHIVEFYSVDNAGNVEDVKNLTIGIDTLEPNITCSLTNNTYFSGGSVDIYYYIRDNTSGLKLVLVYKDGSLYMRKNLNGEQSYTVSLRGLLVGLMNEGLHTIEVEAWDVAGNVREYVTVFYVDKTPPIAEILYPINGSPVSGVVNVTFNYRDNLSPVEAMLAVNGDTVNVTGLYSYLINTTAYPDGSLTIRLTVTDKAGHSSSDEITVIVDNTAPTTRFISPTNNSYVSGVITIAYSIDEPHLDQVWLYIDGVGYNVTGMETYTLDTRNLTDGTHTIMLYANDTLGHVSTTYIVLIIDNTAPEAWFIYPVNNTYVSGRITVVFNYSDANLYQAHLSIYYGENPLGSMDVTGLNNITLDTTGYPDGEYYLRLIIIDKAGNIEETSVKFYIDNTLPYTEITSPTQYALVSGDVNITFNYSDSNLDTAWLIIGGEAVNVTGLYSYVVDTTMYSDGELNIALRVIDKAGNINEYVLTLVIDNTAPLIDIVSPEGYVSGTVTIEWSIVEPHLYEVILYIDDVEVNVTGSKSYLWDTTGYGDGLHTLKVKAVDLLGHEAVVTRSVTIDNTAPTINISSPSDNELVSDTVTVMFSYSDNFEVDCIEVFVDEVLWDTLRDTTSYALDTTQLNDGVHTVKLTVYDKAGNTDSSTITIVVDNTAPGINILYPPNNTTFTRGEELVINWSIVEANLLNTTLYIDDAVINIANTTSYTIDTAQLSIGEHVVRIMVVDKLGHISTAEITIYIRQPATTTPSITPTTPPTTTPTTTTTSTPTTQPGISGAFIGAIIVIAVIVIAATALFILRRK